MSYIEKLVVNSDGHSRRVVSRAERLLQMTGLSPGSAYLDVGTGNGSAPISIARQYHLDATGVDLDPQHIQLARVAAGDLDRVRFQVSDGLDLPFDDHDFDIVSAFKVTHHTRNWRELLAEIIRVLKPGGFLVYSDLVFPPWLVNVAAKLEINAGFPTVEGLNEVADKSNLEPIHRSRRLFLYDAVYRKSAK